MGNVSNPNPRTNSRKFKRLKDLPFFDEIDKKIKAGVAVEEVAEWIQKDMLACRDIKRGSLERQLYRYKSQLPPGEIVQAEPLYYEEAIRKVRRGIDELREMEKMYLFQMHRISAMAETEDRVQFLFPSLNKELKLAADLLDTMVERKMELGLLDKEPERVEMTGGFATIGVGTGNGEVDRLDENTRIKLGRAAGKMVKALENMAEEDEDDEGEIVDVD